MLAALMLTALPFSPVLAEETTDSTIHRKSLVYSKNSKVNGRPITDKEKDVAKQMAKQGAQMGSKAAQIALTAITNPSKADSLGKVLEQMGDEMERLGDSLESLSEDTTFLYEGEDPDTVELTDEDFDEIAEEFSKNFHFEWPGIFGGGMGIFGGILGVLGGILGIFIAIFVVLLLIGIFTSPLWIIALIIWLIVRNNRRNSIAQPIAQTTSTGERLATAQTANTQGAQPQTAAPLTSTPSGLSDENQDMWKSGIMYACVGVGLVALFLSVGLEDFWGIGALVGCIGVAKLIIATTTKSKNNKGIYNNNVPGGSTNSTSTPSHITPDDNYEK